MWMGDGRTWISFGSSFEVPVNEASSPARNAFEIRQVIDQAVVE
jgi:hypothetical protein